MTDGFEQYRHEMTKKLAYEYWERKGRCPFRSPETDWASAEKAVDAYLLAPDENLRLSKFVWDHIKVHFARKE